MMDWTDRHCRVFHRLMTRRGRLYTEMLTTGAIIHGDRQRLLGFDASEHPVALQLRTLQTMAEIATERNSTIIFPAQFMTTVQEALATLKSDSQKS